MKVGDYVITNDRLHIGKIYNINEFREPSMMYAIDFPNADDFVFMGENDFKSSPNIMDLTEVGDYVNGEKVTNINGILYVKNIGALEEINIKSIVTKEVYASVEYRVETD